VNFVVKILSGLQIAPPRRIADFRLDKQEVNFATSRRAVSPKMAIWWHFDNLFGQKWRFKRSLITCYNFKLSKFTNFGMLIVERSEIPLRGTDFLVPWCLCGE